VCGLLRAARKPYVVTLHGGNLDRFARRWPRRVERLLNSAAAVTTPSHFLRERFRSSRVDPHLIPNAVDVAAYRYRPRHRVVPRLVWLRAFHEIYQPELAVTTLAHLALEFPAAQLTMAGPDKGDGSLARARRRAAHYGLSGRVSFPGAASKPALPALLDSSDIFLNTSRVDNTPVSVLEAMAGGLCIVSTNTGGIPYLLRHECDALLTPSESPTAVAAAVRRVLHNPSLAGQLSRNARSNVAPYDWAEVLPMWERLFVSVAEGKGS
jgi:glycosyltransferase involved in cell wall biosynthesis